MIIKHDECNISDESSLLRIFDVAEFSVHDGPGVRVVVYFQGCNVHCDWCHSPHSQPSYAPLLYNSGLCSGCGRCVEVCPHHVHSLVQGKHYVNRSMCTQCGLCIDNCPNSIAGVKGSALHLPTTFIGVEELFEELEPYIRLTGKTGGITLSGGEALLQPDGVEELLRKCKQEGFNTAVETSGLLPLKVYERVLPLVDLWLFGMRIITGKNVKRNNNHINDVLSLLVKNNADVLPRIPMVPGFFDRDDVLQDIVDMLSVHSIKNVCLNPWNRDYKHYYEEGGISLNMDTPTEDAISFCESKIKSLFNHLNFKMYENRTIGKSNDA